MTSHCVNICYAEENAFIMFNSFLIRKQHVILASNIVIVQIVILITSLPSATGFYVIRWVKNMEDGDTEKFCASSLIQHFVFSSRKMLFIRLTSSQVYI